MSRRDVDDAPDHDHLDDPLETFTQRYATRPGGYTRIHCIDNRTGDNAPMTLLELVDNPRDFKLEMTARAVGRDLLTERLRWNSPQGVLNNGINALESMFLGGRAGHPRQW